jgi:hypothetical protein
MSGWLNDDSGQGHVASAVGQNGGTAPTYDQNNKKFGSSSAYFAGTSNTVGGVISIPDSDDWSFGMTFTVQMWVRFDSASGNQWGVLSQYSQDNIAGSATRFGIWDDNKVNWLSIQTAPGQWAGTAQHETGQTSGWHHFMLCRNNPSWHYFIDGVLRYYHAGGGTAYGSDTYNSSLPLILGAFNQQASFANGYLQGWIDALHIEKGVAYNTGTSVGSTYFNPTNDIGEPTATANSVLLMNFNEIFYQVQGTLSHDARIIVIDEDTRTVEHDQVETAGAYAIDVDDNSEKTVVAVRESDGDLLGYGRVIPTQL